MLIRSSSERFSWDVGDARDHPTHRFLLHRRNRRQQRGHLFPSFETSASFWLQRMRRHACNHSRGEVSDETTHTAGGGSVQLRPMLASSLLLFAIGLLPHLATSQTSGQERPGSAVIVELFTSEGCSSCPPADAVLRQISLKQTSAGQLIVGISEHVTYWNDLGWKDPFSAPAFTERQNVYAARLSPEGPYTPQMVVNGREQFVGSDVGALQKALREEAQRVHLDVSILSTTLSSSGLDVKFSVAGETSKPLDIVAVLTDDADQSTVLRGENGGRLLQHVSVARSLVHVATVSRAAQMSAHIALPDGLHLHDGSGHHLILFAQQQHQGAIEGAATARL
jgi:hypothetical protein